MMKRNAKAPKPGKAGNSRNTLTITYPNAAGIDIGGASHYVVVPPRRSASDHLHAVWPDTAHGSETCRCPARSGGVPYSLHARIDLPTEAGIQDMFRHLANDQARTVAIAGEIEHAFSQGRKVLVPTERTDHLDAISAALDGKIPWRYLLRRKSG